MKERQNQSLNGINGAQTGNLVCVWVLFSLTSIIMILRIIAQSRILRRISIDDLLMILAWALQAISAALCTVAISWGFGRHVSEFNDPNMYINAMRYQMYTLTLSTLCAMVARISIAVFLFYLVLRLSKILQYLVLLLIILQVAFNITPIAITWVHCNWVVSRPGTYSNPALCWIWPHIVGWQYAQGVINTLSDMGLALLALGLVLMLDCRVREKCFLGILLSFSLLAVAAAIGKTVEIKFLQASGQDFIYRVNVWNYWFSVENAVLIIAASISKIRPLFFVIFKGSKSSQNLPMWTKSEDPPNKANTGYKSLHSRTQSGSTGKRSTGVPSFTNISYERPSTSPRATPKINIYSIPRKIDRNNNNNNNTNNHPRRHSRLSDSISLRSLPSSLHRENGLGQRSLSNITLNPSVSCNNFSYPSSPRLTCRTVISVGEPSTLPPPLLLASSVPGSGRSSRNSRREDPGISPQNQSNFPMNIGTNNSQVMAAGPFCILQTNNFTVEYEDADTTDHDNSRDVDLGWAVMRNMAGTHNNDRGTDSTYNENAGDGLQLQDVGSILRHQADDNV